jgi:outer membrane protein assembly factor BamB
VYASYGQGVLAVRDGTVVWRFPEKAKNGQLFFAAPAVAEGQVVVGDYLKVLHGLNVDSGQEIWSYEAGDRWVASPLIVNKTILAANADRFLYALDMNGKVLWKFATKQAVWARPSSDGKTVYAASLDHTLYAVDLQTGQQVWKTDLGGAVLYSPVLAENGMLYAGTLANEVVAVDAASGKIAWRTKTEGGLWARPVLHEEHLYFGDLNGKFYSLAVDGGAKEWSTDVGGPVIGAAAVTDQGLIFATETGKVMAIDFTGKLLWNREVNGKLYSSPVINSASVAVFGINSGDHLLVTFGLDGSPAWTLDAPK